MNELIETYRGAICAWECDFYGHMNVQFYVARISDAAATLLAAIGLGQAGPRGGHVGFVAVNQNIEYRSELIAGDLVVMKSGIKSIGKKSFTFHHRLYNAETTAVSMTCTMSAVLLDLETRKSMPIPDDVRARAERLLFSEEVAV